MYGLYDSSGYEIPLAEVKTFTQGIAMDDADSVTFATRAILDTKDRRFDMLNTKYLLVSRDSLRLEFRKQSDRFRLLFSYADMDIYENLKVMPAAYFVPVSGIERIPEDNEQLARVREPGFDADHHVVLAASPSNLAPSPLRIPIITTPFVRWTARKVNSFEMDVNTPVSSVLVVSQTYYPGWKAYIDDEPVEISRANYAFPAIFVPPGSHHVRFSYDTWTLKLGLALTAVTLLILGTLVFREIKRPPQNRI
jgi:hypothetical protein